MGKKTGYADPPWVFKGRALYQLQLVKLEEAKKYIPKELNIVSMFGYTLGGFYLAKYDESPAGVFEECVAIAGIVWNKPTSCAWAARVFVNAGDARNHGRSHVGLPSRICSFEAASSSSQNKPSWWDQSLSKPTGKADGSSSRPARDSDPSQDPHRSVVLHNCEPRAGWRPWRRRHRAEGLKVPVCAFSGFPSGFGHTGPRIKLSLPSFSGLTPDCPVMLRYACQLATKVRLVRPLAVSCHEDAQGSLEDLRGVLMGRPVIAIAFDDMEMTVQEPVIVPDKLPSSSTASWQLQKAGNAPRLVTT